MAAQQKNIETKEQVLQTLISSFEQKYKSIQVIAPKPDLTSVNNTLNDKLTEIHHTIDKGPKPITRQFRLLLFPETNAGYYYKIVFGRLIPWGFLFIVVIYLFSIGEKSVEAWQAGQYNKEGNQCIAAWNEIYAHESRSVRKAMDRALAKAEQ